MKQYITTEQLDELTKAEKEKLRHWWILIGVIPGDRYIDDGGIELCINCCDDELSEGEFPLLSIGKMIEFLGDKWFPLIEEQDVVSDYGVGRPPTNEKLCDALWKAVKEVLNAE